jgi:hypothetical protein
MPTVLILAILIALLVIVLMNLFKKSATSPAAAPGPDLANLKVTDARQGDVLSISGAGDNFSDLDFTIDQYTRLEIGANTRLLLSGMYRDRRVTLALSSDLVRLSDPRKIELEDLGLAEQDLSEMDERQNTADSFEYDGKVWMYRRSHEAKDPSAGRAFYFWEFEEQGGKRELVIQKPEGDPFAATMFSEIPASDVTVYRGTP